jgi:hypothetical protein
MGDIVPPTGSSRPTLYRVTTGGKSLKVSVYETETAYTIFIGGHHKFCIDCLITKGSSVAYLSHIYSNVQCSLEQNFRGGHDTKMIVNLLLSFIKDNFPHIREVEFNDTSSRSCDNNHVVELYEMSYIHTGKTWYEKNFGAQLRPNDAAKFMIEHERFQKRKAAMTWADFKMYLRGHLPFEMEDLYNSTTTWQDFFGKIVRQTGISEFCEFVAPWLHTFMMRQMRFPFSFATYYIALDGFVTIAYEQTAFNRGNRRFTAKRIKRQTSH